MLREIEGSRAIAETVALCRPRVVCAYPISPQTHIIEGVGELVKSGRLKDCEFINVESEFAAMSVSIGASATGARAYTATASQGLLFMTEAVYNASGLGLPIVMTVANRAIGAPINIWNDHSDAMALRDSGWIQLFAETNQHAVDLHVEAFRLAEELSVPVMVCMDGFILTHAVERVEIPSQEQVDRFLPPFAPHQVLDPAAPMSIGAMVGPEAFTEVRYLEHARQLEALARIPEIAAEYGKVVGRARGGLISPYRCEDAETVIVALGSVVGTIKDVVDSMRDEGDRIGVVCLTTFRPFPQAALSEALKSAKRVVVVEKAFAMGARGVLGADVAAAVSPRRTRTMTIIAGLGGRPITEASLRRAFAEAISDELDDFNFLDLDHGVVDRELQRMAADPRIPPSVQHVLQDVRGGGDASRVRSRSMAQKTVKFYQVGSFAVGNRLLEPDVRTLQSERTRPNALTSGHRACQGCGEALGARYVLDAAMDAADGQVIVVNATGCLEVFTTPYPETSWQVAWMHSLFGNAAAVATGVAAALKVRGDTKTRVVAQAGDGGAVDIGFGCLSGMFERNDDVLFVCYDNEGYMNTGVQRSGATPPAARTATTEAVGQEPGNSFGQGKSLPLLAVAHGIPYVATATVADLHDLEAKVHRAMGVRGARYLHVLVPCPLGWGSASCDTIKIARLAHETGLFPLFEAAYGEIIETTPIRRLAPVDEYLRLQRRFGHLFSPNPRPDVIERIQAIADNNIAEFELVEALASKEES